MISINDYIGKMFIGNRYHITCDCFIPLNISGLCVDYEINNKEVILIFDVKGKRVPVGLNTNQLMIEKI